MTVVCADINGQSKSPFVYEQGNTTIKLGGFVRSVVLFDFNGSVQNYDFVNSTLPIPSNWEYSSRSSFDASASRLSLKVTQKFDKIGPLDIYFEMDFRGAGDVLRLRHAYISFLGFTLGQTWSFWYDAASMPTLIDIQGVNSRTFFRTPLIGYTSKIGEDLTFGISAEIPKAKGTYITGFKAVNQVMPDIPVFLQYKGKNGHIKAAAIYRSLRYGVTNSQKIKTVTGFGAQLSGSLKVAKALTLYSNGVYGNGIARYINDLAALNLDLVPEMYDDIQTVPMWGASLGLRADVSDKVFFTSTYSVAGLNGANHNYYSVNEYLKGNYFSGSIFWTPVKNMTLGAEYLHGTRENMNHVKADANRLQMMAMFTF